MAGSVAASIGEHQTGTAIHRGVGGAHGVATGSNVVHEIDLAAAKAPKRGFQVVRFGRCRGQVAAVAGALGFGRRGTADGWDNLCGPGCAKCTMAGQRSCNVQ